MPLPERAEFTTQQMLSKKLGINGIFLDSLQAMYNKVEMIGKIKNRILPPVTASLGLKQGDNLSPLLFDL